MSAVSEPTRGAVDDDAVPVNQNTLTESEGDEGIVVKLAEYEYVQLDRVGFAMWTSLLKTESRRQTFDELSHQFEVDPDLLKSDLDRFIAHLRAVGLVGEQPEPPNEATPLSEADDDLDRLIADLSSTMTGTMTGNYSFEVHRVRLNCLRALKERALADRVPGDFVEVGDPTGSATVLMAALLTARGSDGRRHWALNHVGDEDFESIAVLVLDGNLDEATGPVLSALHPYLSPGGVIVIEDYLNPACRSAIVDFREREGITAEIVMIDWISAWWQVPIHDSPSPLSLE